MIYRENYEILIWTKDDKVFLSLYSPERVVKMTKEGFVRVDDLQGLQYQVSRMLGNTPEDYVSIDELCKHIQNKR